MIIPLLLCIHGLEVIESILASVEARIWLPEQEY